MIMRKVFCMCDLFKRSMYKYFVKRNIGMKFCVLSKVFEMV